MKKRKYYYFYKITNNINGHFYYGVHCTDNLDDGYMGSGYRLHLAYKKYGLSNFTKEILKYFDSKSEMYKYESEIVTDEMIRNPKCYNIMKGGSGWNTSGLGTYKDENGVSFLYPCDLANGLNGSTLGYVEVLDQNGIRHRVDGNDPRLNTGELVRCEGIAKGKSVYRSPDGVNCLIDTNSVPEGYVSVSKGMICVKSVLTNEHHYISIDDPDYLNHLYVPLWTGRSHSEESKRKMRETHQKNHDQQGTKNSQYGTCWIHNQEQSIKIRKDELLSYLNEGWIKGRKMKF